MSNIMDDIAQLSEHIGPRPAGTEEEQQAALYIADELQKGAGFSTVIEDFNCSTNGLMPRIICFAAGFVAALLALIFPVTAIPCFIVGVIVAVLYVLELLGKETLSRFFHNGVSQNVIAKYQPADKNASNRTRKVILVANYDSAKEDRKFQTSFTKALDKIRLAAVGGLIASPVVLFIKMVFFTNSAGAVNIVLAVLVVICLVLMALPLLDAIVRQVSPYIQAANNNAAGVGVLLEAARTIGNGLVSEEDLEQYAQDEDVVIHGQQAAEEAGVMPDDVEVSYTAPEKNLSPEESLAAAKAAIAALTGKPVADQVPMTDIASRLAQAGQPVDSESASVHFTAEEHVNQFAQGSSESRRGTVRERVAVNESTSAAADVFAQSAQADLSSADNAVAETNEPGHETSSFERVRPEALSSGQTGMGEQISKTPEWAKVAQAKAHANKPNLAENTQHVARSQFADTVAAHLTEEALTAQGVSVRPLTAQSHHEAEGAQVEPGAEGTADALPTKPKSELELRLEALHSEIQATQPPHLSQQTREEINQMSADKPGSQPAESSAATEEKEAVKEHGMVEDHEGGEASTVSAASQPDTQPASQPSVQSTDQPDSQLPIQSAGQSAQTVSAGASRSKRQRRNPLADLAGKEGFGFAVEQPENQPVKESGQVTKTATQENTTQASSSAKKPQASMAATGVVTETKGGASVAPPVATVQGAVTDSSAADVLNTAQNAAQPVEKTTKMPSVTSSQHDGATEAIAPIDVSAFVDDHAKSNQSSAPENAVAPIVGMEDLVTKTSGPIPQAETINSSDADSNDQSSGTKQVIVLPDVATPVLSHADEGKQRAPMAEGSESTQQGTRALLSNMLPRIDEPEDSDKTQILSEAAYPQTGNAEEWETGEHSAVSVTGSFATVGTTGSFGAVGDELVADVAPEDRYVEDADDSDFEQGFTETGAYTASSYVEMPKSRAHRIFGRFRSRKKREEEELNETSMTEWIDADETYDARSVGKARGSWESFREDEEDYFEAPEDDGRSWHGGAFSLSGLRRSKNNHEELEDDIYFDEDEAVIERPAANSGADTAGTTQVLPTAGSTNSHDSARINKELKKLRNFRYPGVDVEVWFVALGAEYANHSGMQAFIEEHANELRGALIVNLEGLGAGELTLVEQEGLLKKQTVSSRIKRIMSSASEQIKVGFSTAVLRSRDSTSLYAMNHGYHAVTLMGAEGGQTAWYGSRNDTLEVIDEETLEQNTSFVMSVLKNI